MNQLVKVNIAIIEPHYDDCWLNVGGFMLLNPDANYFIISVSRDKAWNDTNPAKKLKKIFPHIITHDLKFNSLFVNRSMVSKEMVEKDVCSYDELFVIKNPRLNSINELEISINTLIKNSDFLFTPLGLYHPMHEVISKLTFLDIPRIKYAEYPYEFFPSEQNNFKKLTFKLKEKSVDVSKVLNRKIKIFRELYPMQQYILKLSECHVQLQEMNKERFYTEPNIVIDIL